MWRQRVLRFLLVGAVNTAFGYGVFALFLFIGLHYALAALLSTIAGISFNFLTSRRLVFEFRGFDLGLVARFLFAYGLIYVFGVIALREGEIIGVSAYLTGAAMLPVGAIASYVLQRSFVFRHHVDPSPETVRADVGPRGVRPVGWWTLPSVLAYLTVVATRWDFVPIWDGRQYFDELIKAVTRPFDWLTFNLCGHPSMAYALLLAPGQYLDPGSTVYLHGTNALLGAAMILCFAAIARRLFPGPELRLELALLTALFALDPLLVASTVNLNLDFGVELFYLVTFACFLYGRWDLAVLGGLGLVFSKEPGVVLYGLLAAAFFGHRVVTSRRRLGRWSVPVARGALLALPALVLVLFFLFKSVFVGGNVLWAKVQPLDLGAMLFDLRMADQTRMAYWAGIFLINFNWIYLAVLLAWAGTAVARRARGMTRPSLGMNGSDRLLVGFLAISTLFFLTRYETFLNLRYFLPLHPLLLLLVFQGLLVLFGPAGRRLRVGVLAVTLAATVASIWRTVDPVSRAVWGTFDFGRHPMLKMNSLNGPANGWGRDQLVYNLEFTMFHYLQDDIWSALKPDEGTAVAMHSEADWFLVGRLDPISFRRTAVPGSRILLRIRNPVQLAIAAHPPRELYYVLFPNFKPNPELSMTLAMYLPIGERVFERDGYEISVWRMRMRTDSWPDVRVRKRVGVPDEGRSP